MRVKRVTIIFLGGIFWSSVLSAAGVSEAKENTRRLSAITAESQIEEDVASENEGWQTEDRSIKEKSGKSKGLVQWEYENKISGALRGGLHGAGMTGSVGLIIYWWVWLPTLLAFCAVLGPLGSVFAFLGAAMLLAIAYTAGFVLGVPYGVAKTGNAHDENGKMWAAYLGEAVNIALIMFVSRNMVHHPALLFLGGVAGAVGMPILFYNFSRSKLEEKPEVGIRIPLLTVKF
ncbi:MAG: hypothetical protein HY920_08140 [Elusimicrobia bacterium]|nr:hypothetical protein [Elusimicrobiota bacterium]